MERGLLVIISSPSGGGKSTIIKELMNQNPDRDFKYSVSATTRKPRTGEINGKHYIFYSEEEFLEHVKKEEFLEWEHVHQYYYGTLKKNIDQWLTENKIVLLDIDVNGALQIKKKYPDNSIAIFIEPPSEAELISRLKKRKTDSLEEINKRLTRIPLEMNKKNQFDYKVINHKIQTTVEQVKKIIDDQKEDVLNGSKNR